MPVSVDAIYENGMLRPLQPLPFGDRERLRITVDSSQLWADVTSGMVPRPDDSSVLEQFAMLPELELGESP